MGGNYPTLVAPPALVPWDQDQDRELLLLLLLPHVLDALLPHDQDRVLLLLLLLPHVLDLDQD